MLVIRLSLARGKRILVRDLVNGVTCVLTTRKTRHEIEVIVDDDDFERKRWGSHDWIECRDSQGDRILLHVHENGYIDRIANTRKRHKNAPDQLALFAS